MAGLAMTALWMPYLWAAVPRLWLASLAPPHAGPDGAATPYVRPARTRAAATRASAAIASAGSG